jgi:hypothetical protein
MLGHSPVPVPRIIAYPVFSTKVTDIPLNFDNINNVTLAGSWNVGTDGR